MNGLFIQGQGGNLGRQLGHLEGEVEHFQRAFLLLLSSTAKIEVCCLKETLAKAFFKEQRGYLARDFFQGEK